MESMGNRHIHQLLAGVVLGLTLGQTIGCASLDDFEVEVTDEAVIDGTYMTNVAGALGFGGDYRSLNLSATKEFSDQGIDPDDVDAIYVKSISIVATNPENARLDPIIKALEFSVSADGQMTELLGRSVLPDGNEVREIMIGQPSAGLCSDENFSDQTACETSGNNWRASSLTPELNLKDFATSQKMSVTANVELKQQPLFTTTLRTTIKLIVDIDLL